MAPKSGEVDTVEGANSELETSKVMELSTVCGSLTPGKRKAEISATVDCTENEDVDEEEESDEEEEEEIVDKESCESDQEWDVDSFKDVEFHSEDEDDDEEWRRYVRQCYKSEGFDVDLDFLPKSRSRIYSGFHPIELDKFFSPPDITGRGYMEKMLKVVIEKYNQEKKKDLVLDHIVRTVVKLAVGVKAYITFMAKESPEGKLEEYQAKAERKAWQRNIHPILCRPASEQRKRD